MPGIAGQHALEACRGLGRAVGDDDHAGVQAVADADAAAVVDAHPGRAAAVLTRALRIGQSAMASEPSFIASVSRFGRGDRAGVEMIAADDDRRLQLAAARPAR